MITLSIHPSQAEAIEYVRATVNPDDYDFAVIHRNVMAGAEEHVDEQDCWCGPFVVRLGDDAEFAWIAALADQRQG